MNNVINLTHITILQWILIVILSGVVVAIINQCGAAIVSGRQVKSQARLQRSEQDFNARLHHEERENQSLQLLITAHFEQREKSLKDAVDVRDWLWHLLSTEYGGDHDYYGSDDPAPNIRTVTEVLSALDRVSYSHPTRSVRRRAKELRSSIGLFFNSVNETMDRVGGTPSEDQLFDWMKSADEITELIHTPPSLDEIRYPNGDPDELHQAHGHENPPATRQE